MNNQQAEEVAKILLQEIEGGFTSTIKMDVLRKAARAVVEYYTKPSPVIEIGEMDGEIPKMSDQLAAESDMAALDYARICDRFIGERVYDSSHITEAHECGQSWMFGRIMKALASHPSPAPIADKK